jgi:hypothetical protein
MGRGANSIRRSSDAGVPIPPRDPHSLSNSNRKNWDRSQDWKNTGDENRPAGNRRGPGSIDASKLETVHEDDDDSDTVSETQSEGTTVPIINDFGIHANSVGKGSSGSYSDPGDSYGGHEFGKDEIHIS